MRIVLEKNRMREGIDGREIKKILKCVEILKKEVIVKIKGKIKRKE